jgi:hypothetical protein
MPAWRNGAWEGDVWAFLGSKPVWLAVGAGAIAGVIGFTELATRYRDEPLKAARASAGRIYIGLHVLAGMAGLGLLYHFPQLGWSDTDWLTNMVLGGTGAMVLIRTKLFTVHQPGGQDVAVGPAVAVETLFALANRRVDRWRAAQRHKLVAERAEILNSYSFDRAVPFLQATALAFQNLDEGELKRLADDYERLQKNDAFKGLPAQIKFMSVGFDLLTAFGEEAFLEVFDRLETYLKSPPS